MTTLAQRCHRQFPGAARDRGREYFQSGRVSDPNQSAEAFGLSVRGSGVNYVVSLDFSQVSTKKGLQGKCDCPYYDGGGLCKHLWAAILQIDKAGLSALVPENGPLRVFHIAPRSRRDRNERSGEGHPSQQNHRGRGNTGPSGPRPIIPALLSPGLANVILPNTADWQDKLDQIRVLSMGKPIRVIPGNSLAYFVINAAETVSTGKLVLDLWTRSRMPNGELGPLKPNRLPRHDLSRFEDLRDQETLSVLARTGEPTTFAPFGRFSGEPCSRFTVDPLLESHLLPSLASSGKMFLSRSPNGSPDDAERPLRMDRGSPWGLELKIEIANAGQYRLTGFLKRDTELRSLQDPVYVFRSGLVLFGDRMSKISEPKHAAWATALRGPQEFLVPRDQGDSLLTKILTDPTAPRIFFPEDMGWSSLMIEPTPIGVFRALGNDPATGRLTLTVSFDYAGRKVSLDESDTTLVDLEQKRVYSRNVGFEEGTLRKALEILRDRQGTGTLPVADLHRAAGELTQQGWLIYIDNQRLRVTEDFAMNVSTSTDWFDLKMEANFGDTPATQKALLAALEAKNGLVQLADGSVGMLPQEWLARYASFSNFGERTEDGGLRFNKSQGLMLNSVLTEGDHLKADPGFNAFRSQVKKFEGVKLVKTPKGFNGKLRNYQFEGLTWLEFVENFGMGGILADDMGLGKTIQILAFLQGRERKTKLPSLVVAPKSLVFNWLDEAAKFVPDLKVMRYSGAGRTRALKEVQSADLVVTTYGTLRTDIEKLREIQFDIAIVDEAQAIKNPKSLSAMSCKQIRANHKLALTGTPIENSLTDLFSILEFTSPGLLSLSQEKDLAEDTRGVLSRMLKPFMLRRTKEKVLEELPEKSEQVLFCEMSVTEKQFYTSLRDQYRASIEASIEKNGLGKSKIHVLEALLRLRQASCHPGLVNPALKGEPSAKLELMLSHIREVIQEGHKALVFSQFTSLLALVKTSLDEAQITYEYLDGQTVDRKKPVERFQTDPDCPVFLISLKAGGVGLNLTAADYVFILDPWWNPAVEAQAIGRAHRMGQVNKVFAYRMIAKGTVEEKILELQKTKKELAESIISEDKDFMRKLTREDLEQLLT